MTRLSTLLATSHIILGVVLFVENKITTSGLNSQQKHGSEMIMRKAEIYFEPIES